jgi:S1-C subfamily serine protease
VIVEVAGKSVASVSELLSSVAALKPGLPVQFKVQRREDASEVSLTPGKRPKPKQLPAQSQQPQPPQGPQR